MESYGAILKQAREKRFLDFETASRDTTITSQYLQALEEENEALFPGEPYLVGFLSNYAEYLGLDAAKVTGLYRAKKLQESPVPDNLFVRKKPAYFIPLVIALCLAAAGVLTGLTFLGIYLHKQYVLAHPKVEQVVETHTFELTDKPFVGRLYKDDQLVFNAQSGKIVLTVTDTKSKLAIEMPAELSEEVELDVDGDNVPDMIVYVSDLSTTDVDRGAEVRILLKNGASEINRIVDTSEIPNVEELPKDQQRTVILEDRRAYPFTVQATFRSGCVFRYRPDRKDVVEDYFASGDIVNITANNGVRLWMSNGNTVKLVVIANSKSYDLTIAKAGEVVVEDIRWIRDTDGKYKIVIADVP